MVLKNIIPSNIWTSIQSYVSTAAAAILPSQTGNSGKYLTTNGTSVSWVDFFDESNTATGANSATINATSGVAVFTDSISSDFTATFTINNNTINSGDNILFSLSYGGGNTATPVFCYYTASSGVITLYVRNVNSSNATSGDISIAFKKIN